MEYPSQDKITFPHLYVVEASAGSGKTYCLAKRYLKLIMDPSLHREDIPLKNILAVTFTNKAAIEMKARILEFLKKIALDEFSSPAERKDIVDTVQLDYTVMQQKAKAILRYLFTNYNFFQVQTIDSFINAIISGCAFRLNLSAKFKTKKDSHDYLNYSLDALIDEAGSSDEVKKLFHDFLIQYLFIENRTGWFPKAQISAILYELFFKSNTFSQQFIRNDLGAHDVLTLKRSITKLLRELENGLPEATNKTFTKALHVFLLAHQESFDVDELSSFFKNEEFPLNKGATLPDRVKKVWESLRRDITHLCEVESLSVYNHYITIFTRVLDALKELSRKEDMLLLESLNKEGYALFNERALSLPELYYRLATRLRHFLIDEFQDTSRLQWENLSLMIEEALSTGGSLFYVGDKKQAIYRFRGGEVSLMDSVKTHFKSVSLITQTLATNFRSQRAIVEFNNMVFSEGNLKGFLREREETLKGGVVFNTQEIQAITSVFQNATQQYRFDKPDGYVSVQLLEHKDKQARNEAVREMLGSLIGELGERYAMGDIALLVRKNTEVELLTSWFLEQGIPVESEKTLDIREHPYIKELVSLLKFLNSPIDNIAFASFIIGDIFSHAANCAPSLARDFIFRLNEKKGSKDKTMYLYREFRAAFPEIWQSLFEDFFKGVGFIPLYELVVSIYAKFEVLQYCVEYQGFFMRFLELIKEREEENTTISSFLEYFDQAPAEDLYVTVHRANAIKILTIHKAKGLEFPVVVLPFLSIHAKSEPPALIETPEGVRLIHLKRKYSEFSVQLAEIARSEYLKAFIDELNSIYVALTRAKEELYVYVSRKEESAGNAAAFLFPEEWRSRGQKGKAAKQKKKPLPLIKEIPPCEYRDWIPLLKDEFIEPSILQSRDLIEKGEALHCILSYIGNLHGKDTQEVLRSAIELAGSRLPLGEKSVCYEQIISSLLAQKEMRRYFDVPDGTVHLEKEIVDRFGNTKRIDRLIITGREVTVIDYKSSDDPKDAYRTQVSEYMTIMRDIYPSFAITGKLLYLDTLRVEEVT